MANLEILGTSVSSFKDIQRESELYELKSRLLPRTERFGEAPVVIWTCVDIM